jgi:hypothetical protein
MLISGLLFFLSMYIIQSLLFIFPMWRIHGLKKGVFYTLLASMLLYLIAAYLFLTLAMDISPDEHEIFFFACLPTWIAAVWILRRHFRQIVFIIGVMFLYGSVSIDTAMYMTNSGFLGLINPFLSKFLIMLSIDIILMPPILIILRRLCENSNIHKASFWNYAWSLPLSLYAIILLVGSSVYTVDMPITSDAAYLIIRVLLYAILILTCHLLESSLRQLSANAKLSEHARLMESHYLALDEKMEDAQALRHDLRHHISVLDGLITGKEYAQLESYLSGFKQDIDIVATKEYSQNRVVNVLANHYGSLAARQGIRFDLRCDLKGKITIPDADFSALLCNLLENALEANGRMSSGDCFIKAGIVQMGSSVNIRVTNSANAGLNFSDGNRAASSKAVGRTGYGLYSIRMIAKKYNGLSETSWDEESHTFTHGVTLFLPSKISHV